MRIAAGVLLIIVAIINGVAGYGYVLGSQIASGAAELNSQMATTASEKQEADAVKAATSKDAGTYKAFGGFLWVAAALQLVGAILLFARKAKLFGYGVAALSIGAEVGGIVLIGFGVLNIPGLVAGVFAFFGARAIKSQPTYRQPEHAMAA